MAAIASITSLILVIALFITFGYGVYQGEHGKKFYIRPFPALDAIKEAVALCAEKGKPLYEPFGDTGVSDAGTAAGHMMTLSVLQYSTTLAANMGVKVIVGTQATTLIPLIDDVLKNAYRTAGMSELYAFTNIQYAPTQIAYQALSNAIGRAENPAACIQIGMWYGGTIGHTAILRKHVDFLVSGTDFLSFLPFLAAMADYCLFFEEIYGVGTYLNPDEKIRGTCWAEDILKFVLLGITVIGIIAVGAGFTQYIDWIRM